MSGYYNRAGEAVTDIAGLALFGEDRRVAFTQVTKDVSVSTVHLVMDHAWGGGRPLIFETMVFGGEDDTWCARYATEPQASTGHEAVVAWQRGEADEPSDES